MCARSTIRHVCFLVAVGRYVLRAEVHHAASDLYPGMGFWVCKGFFFFFKCVLSMSGGEEGVHGSLLLTDLSLLRSRLWRSEFLDLSGCLSDILADSWRERRRGDRDGSSRSFLEGAWNRRW